MLLTAWQICSYKNSLNRVYENCHSYCKRKTKCEMFRKRKNKFKEEAVCGKQQGNQTSVFSDSPISASGNGFDEEDGFDSQGFVDLTPQRQPSLLGPKQPCQYIGTFAVSLGSSEDGEATLTTHKERTRFVKKKLKEYRYSQKGVSVALLISTDGIKVVSPEGQRVRMAHPLQRISFATCDPDFRLFAYMSHNPSPLGTAIHCHVFIAKHTRKVQDLTALIGKAFQMAFAQSKFPKSAALRMEPLKTSPAETGGQGRRWARLEAQQGHEHSQHALLARLKREQEKEESNKAQNMSGEHTKSAAPTTSTPSSAAPAAMPRSAEDAKTPPEMQKRKVYDEKSDQQFESYLQETKQLPLDVETDGSPITGRKDLELGHPNVPNMNNLSTTSDATREQTSPPLPPKQCSLEESSSTIAEVVRRSQTPPLPTKKSAVSVIKAGDQNGVMIPIVKSASDPSLLAEENEIAGLQHEKVNKCNSHEDEYWYMAGIPREFVTEMLEKSEEGSFFVRDSQSRPGCYALTMRIPYDVNPSGIGNFLILKVKDGVMIQSFDKVLPDLPSLVEHFSKHSDGLPCKLLIAGSNVLCEDEDYVNMAPVDPDYQLLSDFTAMMAELK